MGLQPRMQTYPYETEFILDLPNDKVFMARVLLVGPCPFSLNPLTSIWYLVSAASPIKTISVRLLVVFASVYS